MTKEQTTELKKELNEAVNEYHALDETKDSAARSTINIKIWGLVYEYVPVWLHFHSNIKPQETASSFEQSVYDDCYDKCIKLVNTYEPSHENGASYTTYIELPLRNLLNNKYTRDKEIINQQETISLDIEIQGDDNTYSAIEKNSNYQIHDRSRLEDNEQIYILLNNFSNTILNFLSHQGKKNSEVRKLYYQIFYSESLINALQAESDYEEDWFPKHILDAFLFRFSDFVLTSKCRSTYDLYTAHLHTYHDILQNEDNKLLKLPLSGKIMIEYFKRVENKEVGTVNISQFRKSYKELIGTLRQID